MFSPDRTPTIHFLEVNIAAQSSQKMIWFVLLQPLLIKKKKVNICTFLRDYKELTCIIMYMDLHAKLQFQVNRTDVASALIISSLQKSTALRNHHWLPSFRFGKQPASISDVLVQKHSTQKLSVWWKLNRENIEKDSSLGGAKASPPITNLNRWALVLLIVNTFSLLLSPYPWGRRKEERAFPIYKKGIGPEHYLIFLVEHENTEGTVRPWPRASNNVMLCSKCSCRVLGVGYLQVFNEAARIVQES